MIQNIIGWIGTVSSIIGSFMVAFQVLLIGYILFLIGSISWLLVAIKVRNTSLGILNGFFLVANLVGLFNSL